MKQTVLKNNLQNLLESAENILLLQGPVGDFFLRLANWLTENGKTVHKFNFNAGDDYFYPPTQAHTVVFNDNYDAFPEFLQEYIGQHHIQAVVCFGDTRPYHVIAKRIANENQVGFWAFEEGYFRPYYITLEKRRRQRIFPVTAPCRLFFGTIPQAGPARIQSANAGTRRVYAHGQKRRPLLYRIVPQSTQISRLHPPPRI